jgi:hypothetical protein
MKTKTESKVKTPLETAKYILKNCDNNSYAANRIILVTIMPTIKAKYQKVFWLKVREEIINLKMNDRL